MSSKMGSTTNAVTCDSVTPFSDKQSWTCWKTSSIMSTKVNEENASHISLTQCGSGKFCIRRDIQHHSPLCLCFQYSRILSVCCHQSHCKEEALEPHLKLSLDSRCASGSHSFQQPCEPLSRKHVTSLDISGCTSFSEWIWASSPEYGPSLVGLLPAVSFLFPLFSVCLF